MVSKEAIISLNRERLRLGLSMLFVGNEGLIRLVIIGHHIAKLFVLYAFPELLSGFCVPLASNATDEFAPISINSNPDPAVVFLFPT